MVSISRDNCPSSLSEPDIQDINPFPARWTQISLLLFGISFSLLEILSHIERNLPQFPLTCRWFVERGSSSDVEQPQRLDPNEICPKRVSVRFYWNIHQHRTILTFLSLFGPSLIIKLLLSRNMLFEYGAPSKLTQEQKATWHVWTCTCRDKMFVAPTGTTNIQLDYYCAVLSISSSGNIQFSHTSSTLWCATPWWRQIRWTGRHCSGL